MAQADPNIILGIQGPPDPARMMQQQAQIEESQLKRTAAREQQLDNIAIQKALAQFPSDPESAIDWLKRSGRGGAALGLEEHWGKVRKEAELSRQAELDADDALWKQISTLANLATDESSYQGFRTMVLAADADLGQFLGEAYDPERVTQFRDLLLPAKDRIDLERKALDDLRAGKWDDMAMKWLRNTASQEDRDEAFASMQAIGTPKAVIDRYQKYRQFTPESAAEIEAAMISPEKTAELAGQAEGRDIQRAGQQVTMRGQDISAETAAANRQAADARAEAARAVTIRGQNLTDARAKADSGAAGAKLSATAIEKVAGVDQSMGMLDDIERLLPTMSDFIGPLDGRMAGVRLKTGAGVSPELAEFDAQLTGLKNAVIKATTGAAMSEPEAKRIMGQLPDLKLPESVFKARLATTRRNLATLKKRTIELSGGTVGDAPAKPDDAPKSKYKVEVLP